MSNKTFFAAAMLLMSITSQAQQINYTTSLEKAKATAAQQQKPVAILITIQPPVPTPNFLKGLQDSAVIETLNNNFINYAVAREDTATSGKIIRSYKINRFPSFIFLDAKGGLLFTDMVFLSQSSAILTLANKAMIAAKEMSLVDYDSVYASGNYTTAFLKSYINKKQQAGLTDNADLIEKYINGITVADLNNYAEVLFILKAGPIIEGRAYKLAHTNRKITDSIFKREPLADRARMNNSSINNTMSSAIANKDLNMAYTAANFTRSTWRSDPVAGQRNWQLKIMQYYRGIQDTTNYLLQASTFYDQYYMRISADSIQKRDALKYEGEKNRAMQNAVPVKVNDSTIKKSFVISYPKNNPTSSELNNAAFTFYLMAGNNETHLFKALFWVKRAIELEPLPAYYDTYAHLLYRLQFYAEAEAQQKKAIDLANAAKADTKAYKEEFNKIKKREL